MSVFGRVQFKLVKKASQYSTAVHLPGYLSKHLGEEDSIKQAEEKSGTDSDVDNMAYIFTADRLPQQRQLFYQLCDLGEEGLQRIIHSNDGKETVCSVRERSL